jgi:hypothetical protein
MDFHIVKMYKDKIVNGSRTIKLPVVSDANRNKGNNKIIELRAILQREITLDFNFYLLSIKENHITFI